MCDLSPCRSSQSATGPAGDPWQVTPGTKRGSAWLTLDTSEVASSASSLRFVSTADGGRHWSTSRFTYRPAPKGHWLTTTAVDAHHAAVLFAGAKQSDTATAYRSSDGGAHWRELPTFGWG